MQIGRTRIAPSPTGALHLGNARTFLINWALARQFDWHVVLRIEDLDGPRIKPESVEQTIELLSWLGIDWDEGPCFQADDLKPYRDSLAQLAQAGAIYPCTCTRAEIEAASLSAPHGDSHELRYPGTCRPAQAEPIANPNFDRTDAGWRVRVPPGESTINDAFAGEQSFDIQRTVGDFQVATKNGLPSYQLAVVVDDARQGINRIVRGNDLASSTPRQLLLQQLLRIQPTPTCWHVPLVRGEDGKRLAKRHGDTRLAKYHQAGTGPQRVIGLLAEWSGLGPRRPMSAEDFADEFRLEDLPRTDVIYRSQDDKMVTASLIGGDPS